MRIGGRKQGNGEEMLKTKKFTWLTTIVMSVLLLGCSANEVINVGTPYNYKGTVGVEFESEISNSEVIAKLRTIVDDLERIEKTNSIEAEADVFFSLDRPKEGVSEIRLYVWYQSDGSAILFDGSSDYFTLSIEQTKELKRILES